MTRYGLKKTYERTSITLPIDFLKEVDKLRGDIPRSKYILKLLTNAYYSEHSAKWIFDNLKITYY